MLQWDQASVNSTALAVLSAAPSGPLAAFVEREQPCTRTSGRDWMSSSLHMAGTLCQNQSCLDRVVHLAQGFNSRACSFSPGMAKRVGNYSVHVWFFLQCSSWSG